MCLQNTDGFSTIQGESLFIHENQTFENKYQLLMRKQGRDITLAEDN